MAQQEIELARSTDEEKQSQIQRLRDFHARNADKAPAMLEKLKQTVIEDGNVFAAGRCSEVLLARPDQLGAVRSRRPVPAQHVIKSENGTRRHPLPELKSGEAYGLAAFFWR